MALLEEARRIGADLDDRRRATLLHSLAQTYRKSGDLEGAIRTGIESLALFRAVDARAEAAMTENELALIFLGLGNLGDADRHVTIALRDLEQDGDEFHLAHVEDTAAQIALARGDVDEALARADRAGQFAAATRNQKALIDACLTTAQAARRTGDGDAAVAALRRASEVAEGGPPAWLRRVLTEWSEVAAEAGDHAGAYALSRRALALG
jgi:tetratricopeptide (TPR) repeat protein